MIGDMTNMKLKQIFFFFFFSIDALFNHCDIKPNEVSRRTERDLKRPRRFIILLTTKIAIVISILICSQDNDHNRRNRPKPSRMLSFTAVDGV
jgi:hypothetical protein